MSLENAGKNRYGKGNLWIYTDSQGKKHLLQNRGWYSDGMSGGYTMWVSYGECKGIDGWNGADLEISDSRKRLIQKIERRYSEHTFTADDNINIVERELVNNKKELV